MRNLKLVLAAFASAATIGLAAPAAASFADPVDPVTITSFSVFGETAHLSGTAAGVPFDYPGPTIGVFSLNLLFPDTTTITGQLAFCDDLLNEINPNIPNQSFFFTSTTDPTHTGANDYLSPIGQTNINDIVGLLFAANFDPNLLSDPTRAAAYQLAIWELEYGGPPTNVTGSSGSDPNLQSHVDTLIGQAAADFSAFQADGSFTYVQLESPCDPTIAGTITLNSAPGIPPGGETPIDNCQVQGLITLVRNGTPTNVPEPGTLALLGSGLIGLGAYRRRRKTA